MLKKSYIYCIDRVERVDWKVVMFHILKAGPFLNRESMEVCIAKLFLQFKVSQVCEWHFEIAKLPLLRQLHVGGSSIKESHDVRFSRVPTCGLNVSCLLCESFMILFVWIGLEEHQSHVDVIIRNHFVHSFSLESCAKMRSFRIPSCSHVQTKEASKSMTISQSLRQ